MSENAERACRAENALSLYAAEYAGAFTDLLTDMMHWADQNGLDMEQEIRMAQWNFEAETEDGG